MGQFNFEKWGKKTSFNIGQKVECIYYHEYKNEDCSYERTSISKLIDKPFEPVKVGVITGNAGVHPYWLSMSKEKTEQYLFVKFSEYILPKPIPISCIVDCNVALKQYEDLISNEIERVGSSGYDYDTFLYFAKMLVNVKSFLS